MTKSAMIHARVDPALKAEVETILQALGLSATQAITLFYQQIKLHQGLPFAVRLPEPTPLYLSQEEAEPATCSCAPEQTHLGQRRVERAY